MPAPLLSIRNVSKSFGPVQALSGVNFELRAGEVHALMGENGAGKSTLMNIIGGILQPDAGDISLKGAPYAVDGPAMAQARGIGLVHQEIALCPEISVAENIFMSQTNSRRQFWMERKSLNALAEAALAGLHPVPVTALAGDLSIASQQIVEIAKALTLNCDVLIFDEPTAALTEAEASALFAIIRRLKARGMGIIYISHRMAEIFELSDRITVFRDGAFVETMSTSDTTPSDVATKMVGRPLLDLYPPRRNAAKRPRCLTVTGLSDGDLVKDISLTIHPGEVLGLGGLIGSGRTETALAICGLTARLAGTIALDDVAIAQADYPASIKAGIVYMSEDRKGMSVFLDLSIAQNISALDLGAVAHGFMLRPAAEAAQAEDMRTRLGLRCASVHQAVATLSGGNQQKVALAKMLAIQPRVLFVDEPTRGVDIGAKATIYSILRTLADEGVAVVVISSELPELIGISDRILVLHEGQIAGEVAGNAMTEQTIMHLASGLASNTAQARQIQ